MDNVRKLTIPTEADEQKIVVEWLRLRGVPHFAVQNELYSSKKFALAAYRKALGCVPGAPDIVIVRLSPVNRRPTAVEMKRRRGSRVTERQRAVHKVMLNEGWNVIVAKGCDEAIVGLVELGYE